MICRIRLLLTALAASAGGVAGFAVPASGTIPSPRLAGSGSRLAVMPSWDNVGSWSFDPLYLSSESPSPSPLDGIVENGHEHDRRSSAAIVAAASLLLTSSPAWADSPDWGLFEGRTGSLLHPVAMISMFALSASTALLGFQWKRQRTLGDEISALKKTMPDLGGAGSVGEALGTAEAAEVVDALYVRSLRGAMETEANVAELTRERKELANAGPRDKHFNQGALLLFVGTAFAIEVGFSFLVMFSSSNAARHIFFRVASLRSPFITLAHSLHIPIRVASLALSLSLSLFPSPPPPLYPIGRDRSTRTPSRGISSPDRTCTPARHSSLSGRSRRAWSRTCRRGATRRGRSTWARTWPGSASSPGRSPPDCTSCSWSSS